jgi:fructokinase
MLLPGNNYPVVCFEKILWNVLPASTVPGGAPMNVAYYLRKKKNNPAHTTRITTGEEGNKIPGIFSAQDACAEYEIKSIAHSPVVHTL